VVINQALAIKVGTGTGLLRVRVTTFRASGRRLQGVGPSSMREAEVDNGSSKGLEHARSPSASTMVLAPSVKS